MSEDLLARLTSALSDRYAIVRELDRGGMAVVFLAEDLKHLVGQASINPGMAVRNRRSSHPPR